MQMALSFNTCTRRKNHKFQLRSQKLSPQTRQYPDRYFCQDILIRLQRHGRLIAPHIFTDHINFDVSFDTCAELQDMLPQNIPQLCPDNLENLKKLAEQFQKQVSAAGEVATYAGAQEDDETNVPDLAAGQTFEAAAEESHAS